MITAPMQGSIISPVVRVTRIPGPGVTRLATPRVSTVQITRVAPQTGNQASAGMPIFGLGEELAASTGWGTTLTSGLMTLVGAGANLLAIKDDQKAAARDAANARAIAEAETARSAEAQKAIAKQEETLRQIAQAKSQEKASMTPWIIAGSLAAAAAVVGLLIFKKPKGRR
jgi:hypothetical protein